MRWFPRVTAGLAVLLLAGCASAPGPTTTPATGIQYDDGGANKVDVPRLPTEPPAPGTRTLAAVPEWRLGEWWEYKVTDNFRDAEITIKRVVAGTFGTSYLVGFPLEAFSNDALVLHVPGYGDIDQADLSFEVHDVDMQILTFPLEAGKTWATAFEGRPGNATILSAAEGKATIRLTDGSTFNWTAIYDAETGDLERLDDPNYATVELVGHGYGYEGDVRVPHAHDLVFQHGLFGPWGISQDPTADPTPGERIQTVDVAPGYDRLAFTIIVGGGPNLFVGGLPTVPGSGAYSERVTSPNGTVYELSMGPEEPGGLKLEFFGTGDPTGTWTLEHQADGPGIALAEGIGYHSIDLSLPSGCVLPGPNAAHHLNPCTGKMGEKAASG